MSACVEQQLLLFFQFPNLTYMISIWNLSAQEVWETQFPGVQALLHNKISEGQGQTFLQKKVSYAISSLWMLCFQPPLYTHKSKETVITKTMFLFYMVQVSLYNDQTITFFLKRTGAKSINHQSHLWMPPRNFCLPNMHPLPHSILTAS